MTLCSFFFSFFSFFSFFFLPEFLPEVLYPHVEMLFFLMCKRELIFCEFFFSFYFFFFLLLLSPSSSSFTGVNPQLCGTTEGADINLETSTIITVSGYRSKWRSSESAIEMVNEAGWKLVDLWVADVGLFLWGRGKATTA